MELLPSLFTGSLRRADPRRFLIEAMIGALTADGDRAGTELAVVRDALAELPVFAGLSSDQAQTLIDLADDAIRITGAVGRASVIGRGLPSRAHKLAAFALASAVAMADGTIVPGESDFLEALRLALRVTEAEAARCHQAAARGEVPAFIQDRLLRLHGMAPVVAQLFALRARASSRLDDSHRFAVGAFLAALPDLSHTAADLEVELFQAFRAAAAVTDPTGPLRTISRDLPDPADRYWLMVYLIAAEPLEPAGAWRVVPFIGMAQAAFALGADDLELAATDAAAFPSNLPRP